MQHLLEGDVLDDSKQTRLQRPVRYPFRRATIFLRVVLFNDAFELALDPGRDLVDDARRCRCRHLQPGCSLQDHLIGDVAKVASTRQRESHRDRSPLSVPLGDGLRVIRARAEQVVVRCQPHAIGVDVKADVLEVRVVVGDQDVEHQPAKQCEASGESICRRIDDVAERLKGRTRMFEQSVLVQQLAGVDDVQTGCCRRRERLSLPPANCLASCRPKVCKSSSPGQARDERTLGHSFQFRSTLKGLYPRSLVSRIA